MQWYKCERCGEIFNDSNAGSRTETERSEHFGCVKTVTFEYVCCRSCNSENLDDYSPCVRCIEKSNGDTNLVERTCAGGDLCIECWQASDPEGFSEWHRMLGGLSL